MRWLIDALAAYRLTRLVVKDDITAPLRLRVKRAAMNAPVSDSVAGKLDTLIGCPWCVSVYVGFGVVVARRLAPGPWGLAAEALAASAVCGLVAENLD